MTDIFNDQTEFMTAAGQWPVKLHGGENNLCGLYENLIDEETAEFATAFQDDEAVKEACDILVVTAGFLIALLGPEKAKRAWSLVHASNMAKTVGAIERREDGKILKNEDYKREIKAKLMADIRELLSDERQA